MEMYWPIALIVGSNIFYHICSKQTPENVNPLAAVSITYLVGAAVSLALYFILTKSPDLMKEYSSVNWTSIVLGFAIVGLEVGCMYMYRVGWSINTGYMFESVILAVALIFVGKFLFGEEFSLIKACGIALCIAGLWLIKK